MVSSHGCFVWYELTTTDAEAAKAFYADNACKADIDAIRHAGSDQPAATEPGTASYNRAFAAPMRPMTTIMRIGICSSWTVATANRL